MNNEDYIYGIRAIMEAISTGRVIEKILIRKGLNNDLFRQLLNLARENQIPLQFVPLERINRITRKNHQGAVAFISAVEYQDIEILLPGIFEQGKTPLLLVVDHITDVRNFGAIARSAECAGVDAIIIPEKGMARIGADAVKTSAGALHHIPVCKIKNLRQTIRFLKNSGLKIVAATEKAEKVYTDANLTSPLAIVVGSEDTGISEPVLTLSDEQLKIPILGKIESLNVSVSAALMIYEAVRQRNQS